MKSFHWLLLFDRTVVFNKCKYVPTIKDKICGSTLSSLSQFHKIFYRSSFYESSKRGVRYPSPVIDKSLWEYAKEGRKIFNEELKMFVEEVKERFTGDPKTYHDGDTDIFYRFDSKENLEKWTATSDKMHNEGFSECSLTMNDKGKAVFEGVIDNTIPQDGSINFAGFCTMISKRKRLSFFRPDYYEWGDFSHLELRVKGDGRNYAVNLGLHMEYDLHWFDTFTYILFTHGGPYWQIVRIPFSKFYLTSKGRTQDKQCRVPINRINSIGITATAVPGPFRLEIDYIGCHVDYRHTESFAYEMYQLPTALVSN